MASDPDAKFHLGYRLTKGEHNDIGSVCELQNEHVASLRIKFRRLIDLASQDGDGRVLESGNRLLDLLATAEQDLGRDGRISPLTLKQVRLEVIALVRFAHRMADELRAHGSASDDLATVARRLEQRLTNASTAIEALREAEVSASEQGPILERLEDGALHIFPVSNFTANDLVSLLVGELGLSLADYLRLCEEEFRFLAAEVRRHTDQVKEGMPILLRFVGPPGHEDSKVQMIDFPVIELAALEATFELINSGKDDEAILNLLRTRERNRWSLGEASAESAVIGGNVSEGLDKLPEATVRLDADLLGSEPIDYWAGVTDEIEHGPMKRQMFVGSVQIAEVTERIIQLHCEGGTALTEHATGGMVAAGIHPVQLIQALMAQADWQGGMQFSEEPPEPVSERFEVWVPIEGLVTSKEIELGRVSIVSERHGLERLQESSVASQEGAGELIEEYRSGSSYARAAITASMPNEAEDAGLAAIDLALAWIAVRGRYGAALLPDGRPQDFDRQAGLRTARSRSVVLVYGTETKRQWLRWPDNPASAAERVLDRESSFAVPALPAALEANERLALLALRLAATESDPVLQVQAIWQAIESYVGGTKSDVKLFSKSELKELRQRLSESVNGEQAQALERAFARLNNEPLRNRLRRRLREDAVPVTDHELQILDDLRDARNDAAHGRELSKPLTRELVNYGISIVARMLVHRIAVAGSGEGTGSAGPRA